MTMDGTVLYMDLTNCLAPSTRHSPYLLPATKASDQVEIWASRIHLEWPQGHETRANTETVGYATMRAVKRDANKRPATDTQNNHIVYSKSKTRVGITNGVVILTTLACTLHIEMRNIRREKVRGGIRQKDQASDRQEQNPMQQTLTCKMTTKRDKNSQKRRKKLYVVKRATAPNGHSRRIRYYYYYYCIIFSVRQHEACRLEIEN